MNKYLAHLKMEVARDHLVSMQTDDLHDLFDRYSNIILFIISISLRQLSLFFCYCRNTKYADKTNIFNAQFWNLTKKEEKKQKIQKWLNVMRIFVHFIFIHMTAKPYQQLIARSIFVFLHLLSVVLIQIHL